MMIQIRTILLIAWDHLPRKHTPPFMPEHIDRNALRAGSRRKRISRLSARLVETLVEKCGLSLAEAGRQLGVSSSAVAITLHRRNAMGS